MCVFVYIFVCVCVCVLERQKDYLSAVVPHSNTVTPTPLGNKALCLLTLAKKIVKTAPLSVLFTSVD